jgi:hypothetical protein
MNKKDAGRKDPMPLLYPRNGYKSMPAARASAFTFQTTEIPLNRNILKKNITTKDSKDTKEESK